MTTTFQNGVKGYDKCSEQIENAEISSVGQVRSAQLLCLEKKYPFLKGFEINTSVSGASLCFSLSLYEETSRSETEQAECQCPKRLRAQSAKAHGTETTGTRRQSLNYITVSVKIIKQNAVTQIMLSFGH